jgi:bifunctional enzyme CysN/CysC
MEKLNLVIVGHVDHGKSTVLGRLLADTNSLPEGKLEQVKKNCELNSKPFEYAFLIDALKEEQSQGITIDVARVFFKSNSREYIIIDAPGHIEFLKNMITGASRADAALLVIDAEEGVKENSRRHGYLLSFLGIKQIIVLVNKMDIVDYSEKRFNEIVNEYNDFLNKINIKARAFIPVSGRFGDNITSKINNMKWYKGKSVLSSLDMFDNPLLPVKSSFRMPVQGVYKFTNFGDKRRIIAGTIESGKISIGDEVIFYPSGKKSRINSIEGFNSEKLNTIECPNTCGFTLTEQIFVKREEIACKTDENSPCVSTRFRANIFWLGKDELMLNKQYLLKLGTAKIPMKLEKINRIIDANSLSYNENVKSVKRHQVAECIFKLQRALAFDIQENNEKTSRFVIVDNYEIRGGGIIIESLKDEQEEIRNSVFLRNYKWEKGKITRNMRAERYNQKPCMIVITGGRGTGKKSLGKALEKKLFLDGKLSYFLGIGNVLYGVDSDIKGKINTEEERKEHIRRLSEVSHILLDAGLILIVTAIELTKNDLEIMKTVLRLDSVKTIWLGDEVTTDLIADYYIPNIEDMESILIEIKSWLQDEGFIYKPY